MYLYIYHKQVVVDKWKKCFYLSSELLLGDDCRCHKRSKPNRKRHIKRASSFEYLCMYIHIYIQAGNAMCVCPLAIIKSRLLQFSDFGFPKRRNFYLQFCCWHFKLSDFIKQKQKRQKVQLWPSPNAYVVCRLICFYVQGLNCNHYFRVFTSALFVVVFVFCVRLLC